MREGAAEIAELAERGRYDLTLVLVTLALVVLGLVMIASSAQMVKIAGASGPHFHFLFRQAMLAALGLCVMGLLTRVPYRLYERFAWRILIGAFVLLVFVLLFGDRVRGSRRSIEIAGFDFQPVEAAKIALVIFLAAKISEWGDRIRDFKSGFLPLAGVSVVMAALVGFQPSISNAVLIIMISFSILFIAGARIKHIVLFGLGTLAGATPFLLSVSKVGARVETYLTGGGLNFQIRQSLIALGSGGLWGCGVGDGHQKLGFLPDAHTDFIYSIIGEECGLIGTALVLLAFLFILRRAARTARRAPDGFGHLLALGAGLLIFLSAAINIAMATATIPTAGLPLPFISYGGSSLVASLALIGIIVNVSFAGKEKRLPAGLFGLRRSAQRTYAKRA